MELSCDSFGLLCVVIQIERWPGVVVVPGAVSANTKKCALDPDYYCATTNQSTLVLYRTVRNFVQLVVEVYQLRSTRTENAAVRGLT